MHRIFRITLDDALPVLNAARAKAEEIGVKQTLCVTDESGQVIALHRIPGARLTGVDISIAKAFTAAGHERATHKFNEPPHGPALPGNEAFGISHCCRASSRSSSAVSRSSTMVRSSARSGRRRHW